MIADASTVDGYLEQRRKITVITDLTSWPRKNVLARANALGIRVDPETDIPMARHSEPGSLKDAAQAIMEQRKNGQPAQTNPVPAPEPSLQGRGEVEMLLARAEGIGGNTARQAKFIRERLEKLRATVKVHAQRDAKLREIERHEVEIRRIKDSLRGPRNDRDSAREQARAQTQKERIEALGTTHYAIRQWAAAEGLTVRSRGWIPGEVMDAYEAAHQTEVA